MILVVSYPGEDHTEIVVRRLEAAGREVHLLDLGDFPSRSEVELAWEHCARPTFAVTGNGGSTQLSVPDAGWWRRVRPHSVDSAIAVPSMRAFAENETSQALNGMIHSMDCPWVNPPTADAAAHHKPLQWTMARRVGLELPRTLVTNSPERAREFVSSVGVGRTVFKAFLASVDAWRETRVITDADVMMLDAVRLAPVIFQEYVEGVDLRITVIGTSVFAAEIDARNTSYPVDMRMVVGEAAIRPVQLPSSVEHALLSLQDALGLVYGAIDMKRTADGNYLFLEVNPAGQWLFVEQHTGLPISEAVAAHLMELERSTMAERATACVS